jgi:putative tryptophan/tyrosine transport system substrate-binding protein
MRRRDFIRVVAGSASFWPLAARAQQTERMRRIGLLMGTADDREGQARVTAFKQRLQELGWTDGRNTQIETLWRFDWHGFAVAWHYATSFI